jgi:hypothetical protein
MNALILLILSAMPQTSGEWNRYERTPIPGTLNLYIEGRGADIVFADKSGATICSMTDGHWTYGKGQTPRSCQDAIVENAPVRKDRI